MLKSLAIQNYALIDSLNIDFEPGFSVITGETGAGKSIILGALSLILGQRAEARYIKQNEQKCTIEGVFDVSKYNLQSFFDEKEWEFDPSECIIRREIWINGKSRAFVNDSPVYLNDLKELGDKLIDIHSQHQNLSLNDNSYQLNVLDLLARTKTEKDDFQKAFRNFQSSQKTLHEMQELARRNKEEEDFLQFQFAALSEAKLSADEQEMLEAELKTMTHAEEIKSTLFEVANKLSGGENGGGIEATLKQTVESVRGIVKVFPKVEDLVQRIESAYIDLKDVRAESEKLFDEVDFDAERMTLVEERLSLIYELQKKHSVNTNTDLLNIARDLGLRLKEIASFDDQIIELTEATETYRKQMNDKAKRLTQKRAEATLEIEKQLSERLHYLGMPNARFVCRLLPKQQPDGNGAETVSFLFSANKNVELQPVAQIASGGEISRLMLCLKSMIAGVTALPTIIFDEIDTGTSGEIADKMGGIMRKMATEMQVVAISHLPQIASKGNVHYIVYKNDEEGTTQTHMKRLSNEERVTEIARMLSGAQVSEQAVENAKVMLNLKGV